MSPTKWRPSFEQESFATKRLQGGAIDDKGDIFLDNDQDDFEYEQVNFLLYFVPTLYWK